MFFLGGELTAVLQGNSDVQAARHRRPDDLLKDCAAITRCSDTFARGNGRVKWLGWVAGLGHGHLQM